MSGLDGNERWCRVAISHPPPTIDEKPTVCIMNNSTSAVVRQERPWGMGMDDVVAERRR
jgi:hypothetical protein